MASARCGRGPACRPWRGRRHTPAQRVKEPYRADGAAPTHTSPRDSRLYYEPGHPPPMVSQFGGLLKTRAARAAIRSSSAALEHQPHAIEACGREVLATDHEVEAADVAPHPVGAGLVRVELQELGPGLVGAR